jgi:uncharacterized membrane protein YsdA (DUF1294 family)
MPTNPLLVALALVWHTLASAAALTAYGLDKHRAARGRRRIPERNLHALALAGGWPGGLLAMHAFKHKRRKAAFVRVFWLTVVAHLAVLTLLLRLVP